jgi:hypothetical protein
MDSQKSSQQNPLPKNYHLFRKLFHQRIFKLKILQNVQACTSSQVSKAQPISPQASESQTHKCQRDKLYKFTSFKSSSPLTSKTNFTSSQVSKVQAHKLQRQALQVHKLQELKLTNPQTHKLQRQALQGHKLQKLKLTSPLASKVPAHKFQTDKPQASRAQSFKFKSPSDSPQQLVLRTQSLSSKLTKRWPTTLKLEGFKAHQAVAHKHKHQSFNFKAHQVVAHNTQA